jgi:hypothetical protein
MKFSNLGIVIPLKAKSVSTDWNKVCLVLKQTIDSVLNQTSHQYRCVVVGHDKPDFFNVDTYQNHNKVEFIYFDELEPPNRSLFGGEQLQLMYEVDRCTKIAKGMLVLQSCDISNWFALDADDLIHKDMVKLLTKWNASQPIIFDNGYFLYDHLHLLNKTQQFSLYCGSCCIIPANMTQVPKVIDSNCYRTIFFGKYSHVLYKTEFVEQGITYFIPDQRLTMYVRSHGENISLQISRQKHIEKIIVKIRKVLGMVKNYTPLTDKVRADFSIDFKK